MKRLVIAVLLVFANFSLMSQYHFHCNTEEEIDTNVEDRSIPSNPKYGHIKSYIPCMDSSNAFYNPPIITIDVNINIIQKNDGSGNFQDNEETRKRLRKIIGWINQSYSGGAPSDQIEWVDELPSYDSRIRFSIGDESNERIYFYQNTNYWNPYGNTNHAIDYFSDTYPDNNNAINVYVFGNPADTLNFASASVPSSIDFYQNQYVKCYYWKYESDWAIANLLGHEFGHSLKLQHTYLGGGASAICNIEHDEFMRDIFMLDTITQECNCPHDAV